jgi:hypothetical protein
MATALATIELCPIVSSRPDNTACDLTATIEQLSDVAGVVASRGWQAAVITFRENGPARRAMLDS